MQADPAELPRAFVPMDDAQAAFQIIRLSTVTYIIFLLRTLSRSITRDAAKEYDTLQEWALTSVIAGESAGALGAAQPGRDSN